LRPEKVKAQSPPLLSQNKFADGWLLGLIKKTKNYFFLAFFFVAFFFVAFFFVAFFLAAIFYS
jgi:hypothetical protein